MTIGIYTYKHMQQKEGDRKTKILRTQRVRYRTEKGNGRQREERDLETYFNVPDL